MIPIRLWLVKDLLKWIEEKLHIRLKFTDEKFLNTEINERVFLSHAGDIDFFVRVGFSPGSITIFRNCRKHQWESKCCRSTYIHYGGTQLVARRGTANEQGL